MLPFFISVLASLIVVGVVSVGGIALVKSIVQANYDAHRLHYTISFGRDTEFETFANCLRSFEGLSGSTLSRLNGVPTIVFETVSDERGLRFHLVVNKWLAPYVVNQLRAFANVTPEEEDKTPWTYAQSLSMTSTRLPLRIPSPEKVSERILLSMTPVKPGQAVMFQWIISPGQNQPPSDDKQYQEKFGDSTFLASGRLAARGEPKEAERMVRSLSIGLLSVQQFGVTFKTRWIPASRVSDHIHRRSSPLAFPCTFSVEEAAAVIAWPSKNMSAPGLAKGRSKPLSADYRIPEVGFKIGLSNFPGSERPLAISPMDRTRHLYILGPTGVGKSTLIRNLAVQEIWDGHGTTVFDPKGGDLIADIIDAIPPRRVKDVILFDPTDLFSIGLNVLEGDDPYLVTDQVMAVFDGLFDIYKMPRTADVARSGLLTLTQAGMTLMDLPPLLAATERGKDFRHQVTRTIQDRGLRGFWDGFEAASPREQTDIAAPLLRRLRPFELRPSLRATLGQTKSGFDLKDVIAQDKILLVSLSKGLLGEDTSALFGALLFSKLWQAVQTRSGLPTAERKPYFCHVDEFQNYLHLPMSIADVLAESRSYGFGLTLAHQNLGQLPPQLRESVLANARSKIVFQSAASDASTMAREFAPYIDSQDLQNLGAYEVVARLACAGEVAPPVTATTYPSGHTLGSAAAVRAASRTTYGRPIVEVDAEIAARQKTHTEARRKPSVGVEEES